jgi:hypothetical protein
MLLMLLDHRVRRIVLAAVALMAVFAFAASARAHASTQLINAGFREFGGGEYAMEVAGDGTNRVFLKPSNPQNQRQQWEREPFGTSQFLYRNAATQACLVTPQFAGSSDDLKVGACQGIGARNRWLRKNPAPGNGAFQIVSAQTGQAPLPNFFAFPSDLLKLTSEANAASTGSIAEYHGA